MKNKITIGTRGSKLALIYAQSAKEKIIQNTNLNDEDVLIKKITTKGDQIQDVRLSEVGGKGLFSTNIEKELLDKKIDIAVHALKDMPAIETDGLRTCLLYTSDAADDSLRVDLGGRRIIKKTCGAS